MKPYELGGHLRLRRHVRALEASGDYRVLHRLPTPGEMWMVPMPDGPDITLGAIDIETTGLADDAKIVEIGLVKLSLVDGQLADMTYAIDMQEDPSEPLSEEIRRITGLTDADLAGRRFDETLLAEQLGDCDALIAFNSSFDAPRLRRRFPGLEHPWLCARHDFDWATAGYLGRSQEALLAEHGIFYRAHRAAADTAALAVLLSLPAADGRAIAAHIVERGQREDVRITAVGAPFELRGQLRDRGYRWNAGRRVWTIDVAPSAAEEEIRTLRRLSALIRPALQRIDWYDRHTG